MFGSYLIRAASFYSLIRVKSLDPSSILFVSVEGAYKNAGQRSSNTSSIAGKNPLTVIFLNVFWSACLSTVSKQIVGQQVFKSSSNSVYCSSIHCVTVLLCYYLTINYEYVLLLFIPAGASRLSHVICPCKSLGCSLIYGSEVELCIFTVS